jgi:hypothetical protein
MTSFCAHRSRLLQGGAGTRRDPHVLSLRSGPRFSTSGLFAFGFACPRARLEGCDDPDHPAIRQLRRLLDTGSSGPAAFAEGRQARGLVAKAQSSPPPGLAARGTEQSAPQRNGRRGGAILQTEPGLQASWQFVVTGLAVRSECSTADARVAKIQAAERRTCDEIGPLRECNGRFCRRASRFSGPYVRDGQRLENAFRC